MTPLDGHAVFDLGPAEFALRVTFAVTATWAVAGLATLALRSSPAALRHRLWSLATAATLALPALLLVLPEWRVGVIALPEGRVAVDTGTRAEAPVTSPDAPPLGGTPGPSLLPGRPLTHAGPPPAPTAPGKVTAATAAPPPTVAATPARQFSPAAVGILLWLLPAAWLLARHAVAVVVSRRIVRGATAADASAARRLSVLARRLGVGAAPVLLESAAVDAPLCLGCVRHAILLPPGWRRWPGERLDAVLTHELAHVARRDVLWQTLARVARAVYWFHPLAWVAAWRMRVERELACDDWVLRGGVPSTRYARCLLDVAALAHARASIPTAGVAMAAASGLEHRVAAILDPRRRRLPVSRRLAAALLVAAAAMLCVMGVLSPLAPEPASADAAEKDADLPTIRVEGRVENEKGEPAADVVVETVYTGRRRYSARTQSDGKFTLQVQGETFDNSNLRAVSRDEGMQGFLSLERPKMNDGVVGGLKVVLKPAKSFSISVSDDKGAPVAGARVLASADYTLAGETTTDASGKATLRIPADARPMFVLATKEGVGLDYVLFWRKDAPRTDPYRLEPDHSGPLAFVLNGMKDVTVRVVDEQGKALAGAWVYPWYFEKPRKGEHANISGVPGFNRTTDATGTATFQVPADNQTAVTFWAQLKGYSAPERPVWDPKKGTAEVEARLVKQVHVVGRVVDEQGRPAAGARVRVGGDGYTMDSFRGETRSAADGSFGIDVNPNQYYLFVADLADRASGPQTRIVKNDPPAQRVELALAPAVRVRGAVTAGPDRKPVPKASVGITHRVDSRSYDELPEDQQFPGGVSGRKAITPGVTQHGDADDKGAFEFFVGPGDYDVNAYASGAFQRAAFKVSDDRRQYTLYGPPAEKEPWRRTEETRDLPPGGIELAIHFVEAPGAGPKLLKGRVVRRDDPKTPVPEAALKGDFVGKDDSFREATAGKDGTFTVRHGNSELVMAATSPDGKQRGIVVVKPEQSEGVEIPVGPMASATGRLLDHEGKPLAHRSIQYGVRVGLPGGPTSTMFGDYVETDAEGNFTINEALVPGFDYELLLVMSYGDEGRPNRWRPAGKIKAEHVERVELGNLILPKPFEPKTYKDYAAGAFASKRPLAERLTEAKETARLSHQRVLVILGSSERPVCQELYRVWHDPDRTDVWTAMVEYVPVAVDADAADAATRTWAEQAKLEWPKGGLTLAVFDVDGRLIGQARESAMFLGNALDRSKLIAFAAAHAPPKPDARKLLDDALARAKREGKHVLLDESSPYCPPCISLSKYLEKNRAVIEKDYVVVTLDRRFPNGAQILTGLRREGEASTPWTAVLNADGTPLITSDGPDGNIGFPSEAVGRAHWEKMLRTGAWRLSEPEIQDLMNQVAQRQ